MEVRIPWRAKSPRVEVSWTLPAAAFPDCSSRRGSRVIEGLWFVPQRDRWLLWLVNDDGLRLAHWDSTCGRYKWHLEIYNLRAARGIVQALSPLRQDEEYAWKYFPRYSTSGRAWRKAVVLAATACRDAALKAAIREAQRWQVQARLNGRFVDALAEQAGVDPLTYAVEV